MTSEEVAELHEWVRSLPPMTPKDSDAPRWSVSWESFAGPAYRRNQGRCGNCTRFAALGLLEVQYAVQCCDADRTNDDRWYLDRGASCPCPAPDPVTGNADLHLSVQLLMECSRPGFMNGCAGGNIGELADFLRRTGSALEVLQPFELADERWDDPSPAICPMLDRRLPRLRSDGTIRSAAQRISDRNRVCDIEDIAARLGVEPRFYRATDGFFGIEDPRANWDAVLNHLRSGPLATTMLWAIADLDGDGIYGCTRPGGRSDHAVLVIGYDLGGDVLLIRNSHGDRGTAMPYANVVYSIRRGECNLGEDPFFGTLRVDSDLGCPVDWLAGDADLDGIPNIDDACLYVPNNDSIGTATYDDEYRWNDPGPRGRVVVDFDPTTPGIDPVPGGDDWPDGVLGPNPVWPDGCDNCRGLYEGDRWDSDWLDLDGDTTIDHETEWHPDGCGVRCDGCARLFWNPGDMGATSCLGWDGRDLTAAPLPGDRDADGDWRWDGLCDNCDGVRNGDQANDDGDAAGNACDGCPWTHMAGPEADLVSGARPDGDGDGIWDSCDNCPAHPRWDQEDHDGDGTGTDCDPCPFDPAVAAVFHDPTDQNDFDVVPGRPGDPDPDPDRDRIPAACRGVGWDICPDAWDPGQEDSDRDPSGALAPDRVGDACDNCPAIPNRDQANCNAADEGPDGPGDACDPYPCVDRCMRAIAGEASGDPTIRVVRRASCSAFTGDCTVSEDPVPVASFCAVGGDDTRRLANDQPEPMQFPTEVRGCWCEPDQLAECSSLDGRCPTGGVLSGRWTDIDYAGRCTRLCPDPPLPCRTLCDPAAVYRYEPLYAHDWTAGLGGEVGDLRGNYVPYYQTAPEVRRRTQPWDWNSTFDDDGPSTRYVSLWFKPQEAGWFAPGYADERGNTYTGWRLVHGDVYVERGDGPPRIPTGDVHVLLPATDVGGLFGFAGSPMQWFADLLGRTICLTTWPCPWPEEYFFEPKGPRFGGLVISRWDDERKVFADTTGSKLDPGAVFDLASPSIALADDARGVPRGYWLFGGTNANGAVTRELWGADRVDYSPNVDNGQPGQMPGDTTSHFLLRQVSEAGNWPAARKGAVLVCAGGTSSAADGGRRCPTAAAVQVPGARVAVDPGALLLAGGEGQAGLLADIWIFRQDIRVVGDVTVGGYRWRPAGLLPGLSDGLADASAIHIGSAVWLFGGRTAAGASDAVWRIETATGRAERVAIDGPSPGGRIRPALAYDPQGRRVLMFGGVDGAGVGLSDLWALSVAAPAWTRLAAPCAGSGCPVLTGRETLRLDPATGEITLVADRGGAAAQTLAWTLRDGLWQSRAELLAAPGQTDCDGDGSIEPLVGARCDVGEGGFPSFGRILCGDGAPSCRAPAVPGTVVASYTMPTVRAAAGRDDRLFLLGGAAVERYRVQADGSLAADGTIRLRRAGHDLALLPDIVLVADGQGLTVYRESDGRALSSVRTCGKARRVFVTGRSSAVVLGLRSLLLVDLSDPEHPATAADLRLSPTVEGLRIESGGGCGRAHGDLDDWWDAFSPCGASGRDVAALSDGRLFLNLLGHIYVLDLRNGDEPFVSNGVPVGLVREMRAEGPHLYANLPWGDGLALTQESTGEWYVAGSHDVARWVEGTVDVGGYVVWAGAGRLDVATRQ